MSSLEYVSGSYAFTVWFQLRTYSMYFFPAKFQPQDVVGRLALVDVVWSSTAFRTLSTFCDA